jgi:hypothetical protein
VDDVWAWTMLAVVGIFHGINPAMGWLFAVARGFHVGQRAAVYRSLVPIGLGHAAAFGIVVAQFEATGTVLDSSALQLFAVVALLGLAAYRLWRGARRRGGTGFQAGAGDLALWSFLAATAYDGESQMLVPGLLGLPFADPGQAGASVLSIAQALGSGLAAIAIHTLAMTLTVGLVAIVVFDRLGFAAQRPRRLNLDRLWAFALVAAGGLILFAALVTD